MGASSQIVKMDFSSSEGSKKDRRPPARSRGPFGEADRPASCAGGGPGWAMSLKLGKLPEMAKVNLTRNFQFNFFLVKWYSCREKQYSNSSEDEPQNFDRAVTLPAFTQKEESRDSHSYL